AEKALLQHDWPGNVRELQNCIKRAMLLARSKHLTAADLQIVGNAARPKANGEPDRNSVIAALEDADGVVAKAARSLGMSRQALYRRMEKFDINK
ncbi:MAG: sigma-54-dependent Fis family transcriptional regulator, partial [Gammaproteobacteria bacterium]|nr:sigma-54-dependent Fis family transcriptional regulator [Gammaproteobacteria bacterium]